ncbi:putative reverse transcriptase domain-containing protein [Tanacetum coccineum]|uniref:Reverse transcriptase domain-containing protein n=1 Tax=Tanacetum coccineum TaxID=301880 RepID=A0ABQ5FH23_9ASTR
MVRGFLSQKGSRRRRGIKEKQVSMTDKSVEVSMHANVALGSNCTPNVVNSCLESFPTVSEANGIHSPTSAYEGPNPAGNTPGMSTSYANVIGEPSRKALNLRTLFTPAGNEVDVVVPVESIRAISERFADTTYGFFLGKRFSSIDGLDAVLENGIWFIRNNPLIMKKWNLDVNLLKEDVVNHSIWVKLHGVPVTAFSEDGLSAIAIKLSTHLMLESYTFDMCIQSWGKASYARALIEVQADVELKDHIVVAMPKLIMEGFYTCTVRVEYEWKPPKCACLKIFGHV